MMIVSLKKYILCVCIMIALFISLEMRSASSQTARLNFSEIDDIARNTTVLIAKNLEVGQVENASEDELAGSGVIVRRYCRNKLRSNHQLLESNGELCDYYVLTNAHVVPSSNVDYAIRTPDGNIYAEIVNEDLKDAVRDFIKYDRRIYLFNNLGYDLSLLIFKSNKKYPVAAIGDSENIQNGEVFLSGWALPPRNQNYDIKRIRQTLVGNLLKRLSLGEVLGNYTLNYTLQTKVGISGGPVFNTQGKLIGIHGKGESTQIGVGTSYAIDINSINRLISKNADDMFFSTKIDPLSLDKYSYLISGDNLTSEERKKFVLRDMLRDDPRRGSVEYLDYHLKCLTYYEDNVLGVGLTEAKYRQNIDMNHCLNNMRDMFLSRVNDLEVRINALEKKS